MSSMGKGSPPAGDGPEPYIPRPRRRDVRSDSAINLNGRPLGTLADFWAWAFTDLRDNTFRGIFAEWLVAQLLGLPMSQRGGWDCYDLTAGDKRIEVKCSSYLQPWAQRRQTLPVYSRLFSQCWDANSDTFRPPDYNADIYVFCLQACQDAEAWDALDLTQWQFWVLPREVLAHNKTKTLSQAGLVRLARHAYDFTQPMRADDLSARLWPILGPAERKSAPKDESST